MLTASERRRRALLGSLLPDYNDPRLIAERAFNHSWLELKDFNPYEPRDPHSGKWINSSGLVSGPAGEADRGLATARVPRPHEPVQVTALPDEDVATARSLRNGGIGVHPDTDSLTAATAIVHEYGHIVDRSLMGKEDEWFTQSQEARKLLQVLNESPTVRRIRNDQVEILKGDPRMVRQLTQARELFARAFEQYVALRSRSAALMEAVNKVRRDPLLSFQYWSDAEFAPIARELERAFVAHERS